MPAYQTSPFVQRVSLLPGVPAYSFGSFNDRTPPSRFSIQSVAIASNVATLAVTLLEGLIPIVGALISVQGTQTPTSGGAPNFNVVGVALTGVSINSTTGVGTLTFALTSSNISTTNDSGQATVPQPEIGDAITTAAKGQQFAVQSNPGLSQEGKNPTWEIHFPSAPASFSAQLEGAMLDVDSQYEIVGAAQTTAGTYANNSPLNFRFFRINITALSGGTNPTVVSKIMV
jgi:hypothetical protein